MDPTYRSAFNAAYTDELFARYHARLEGVVGKTSFRLAETPFFMPPALKDRLDAHARSILALLGEPARVERMRYWVRLEPGECSWAIFPVSVSTAVNEPVWIFERVS